MVGGDLHWIWTGYEIYQEVDYVCPFHWERALTATKFIAEPLTSRRPPQVYGVKALQNGDGFPNAQGLYPYNSRSKKPLTPFA